MKLVTLTPKFLNHDESHHLMLSLYNSIQWHDKLRHNVSLEMMPIKRKMAYVSDIENYTYSYHVYSFPGQTWFHDLSVVRDRLNKFTGRNFNSVLLNLYENGQDVINWHSDKEEQLGPNPTIACVNLGATRKFWFRKKTKTVEEHLSGIDGTIFFKTVEDGDLLMMNEGCQSEYLHAILKEPEVKTPRISLTFREVIPV